MATLSSQSDIQRNHEPPSLGKTGGRKEMHRSLLGRLLPLRAADSDERFQELYVHLDGNGAEALQGGRLPATCLVGQLPSCNSETPRSRMDAEGGVKIVRESIG